MPSKVAKWFLGVVEVPRGVQAFWDNHLTDDKSVNPSTINDTFYSEKIII
jgi:hypothetical protein